MKQFPKFAHAIFMAVVCSMLFLSTGCIKNDIGDLEVRVKKLEDAVKSLEGKYEKGFLITSVESVDGGYQINFSAGKPVVIEHGVDGADGNTPTIEVTLSGNVLVNGVNIGVNIMGETGSNGTNGKDGVSPRIKVDEVDGQLRIYYTLSTKEIPDDNEWIDLGVDLKAPSSANPLLAIEINDANGTVTFTKNDATKTRLTFSMTSTAQFFEIMTREVIEFKGSESLDLVFRVNPSGAYIPTGEGDAIKQWTLDQISTTRASYVTTSEVFSIKGIRADGDKKGQYIATVVCNIDKHDESIDEYNVALVLNNNRENAVADDALISSRPFGMKATTLFKSCRSEYFGGNKFWLSMFTMELDDYGYPAGNGTYITLELFSNEPSPENISEIVHPKIASGTYTVGTSGELFTLTPGKTMDEGYAPSGLIRVYDAANYDMELFAIKDGIFTAENIGGNKYAMAFDFMLSDGSKYKAKYEGPVDLINTLVSTSLTSDVEMEPLTKGNADSHSYYNTRTYEIELTSDGVNMDEGTGTGDRVKFELYTSQDGDGSVIPAGIYTVDGSNDAGTVGRGSMVNTNLWGSWYRRIEDGKIDKNRQGPFHSGTVTVGYNDGIYTMVFDIADDVGNKIAGRFEGSVEFY